MRMRNWLPPLGLLLVFSVKSLGDAPAKEAVKLVDAAALAERIDQLVEKTWKEKKIKPAPLADHAEYLRRIYLDLVGRIPATSEIRDFLRSDQADKRQRVVNRLLSEPLYVTHLSATWRSILLPPNNNQQFQFFTGSFKAWLDKQIKENVPYDQVVREIITVPVQNQPGGRGQFMVPSNNVLSPVGFFQANELKAENVASSASRIFLGVKLECAQCHDHPFTNWKQEQFWEVAAFFSALQSPQAQRIANGGRVPQPFKAPNGTEIKIPGKDKVVQAKFLDGQKPAWREGVDSRVILAEWMTAPENPYFARTAVNRVWAHFFGLGLIDPVDDEPTDENPVSHPELLAELTQQFIAHKFDVKYLIRAITLSKAYQRTSAVSHESQQDSRAFARMALKGLTPEQLFDSLAQATGYFEGAPQVNPRGFVFGANSPRAEFLSRFSGQDKRTETHTSILQALALMNGKFIADATLVDKGSRDRPQASRSQTLTAVTEFPGWTTEQRIEALYLAALGRPPRQEELVRLTAYVNRGGPTEDQAKALGDVFWALLNSSEFMFNH